MANSLVVSLCLLIPLSSAGPANRIWNGQNVASGEAPFVVDVQVNGQGHYCGGFIYSWDWVVTTAGCVYGYISSDLKVVVGQLLLNQMDLEEETIGVRSIQRHPSHDLAKGTYDIAMIQLERPMSHPSAYKVPYPIADSVAIGTVATVYGWGDTGLGLLSANLKKANVTIQNCASDQAITICAGGSTPSEGNACRGDFGGPLVVAGSGVVGLVSHSPISAQCGYPSPMIYTRLAPFSSWMASCAGAPGAALTTTTSRACQPVTTPTVIPTAPCVDGSVCPSTTIVIPTAPCVDGSVCPSTTTVIPTTPCNGPACPCPAYN